MNRAPILAALLLVVAIVPYATAGLVYQQTMDATWLDANATFYPATRPVNNSALPAYLDFPTGSVAQGKLLEVPMAAAGTLPASNIYTVDINISSPPLAGDSEFTVGVTDGSRIVGLCRSDNSGGTAFFAQGSDNGATFGWGLTSLKTAVGQPTNYDIKLVVDPGRTTMTASYPSSAHTYATVNGLDPSAGLSLVAIAGDPSEQFRINSFDVTVTQFEQPKQLHYSFDTVHTSGSTVTDLSGAGNNGTNVGASPVAAGAFGEALNFGSGDYVTVNKALLSQTDPNQPYTIAAWVKSNAGSGGGVLTQYAGNPHNDRFGLRTDDNAGHPNWWSGVGGTRIVADTTNVNADQQWHHVAFVKNADQSLNVYVDGVDETPAGSPTHTQSFTDANTEIGRFSSSVISNFGGSIDEVFVYGKALSQTEVQNLQQYNTATPTVLHYTFDSLDINGNVVLDTSGAGNDGLNVGADPVSQGKFAQALNFDNNEYVTLGKALFSTVDATQPYTIAAWVKSDAGNGGGLITQYTSAGSTRFGLKTYLNGGKPNWFAGGVDGPGATTTGVNDGDWHHVAFVKDAAQNVRVFVDGMDETPPGTWTHTTAFQNTDTEIGRFASGVVTDFGGSIDEMWVFERPLSNAEIANLRTFNTTQPVLLHYSFDTATISGTSAGSTVADLSPEANHGTVLGTGTAIAASAPFGQGLTFSGSNAVSVGKALLSTTDANQPYSVAFWMRMSPTADGGGIFTQYLANGSLPDYGKRLGIRVYGDGQVSWWAGHPSTTSADYLRSSTGVDDNTWHHIAFVKDNWQNLHLYIDGVNVTTMATGSGTHTMSIMDQLTEIGAFDTGFVGFEGDLDELWVYRAALTAADIHNLHIANSLVPEPTTLALLGFGLAAIRRRRVRRSH